MLGEHQALYESLLELERSNVLIVDYKHEEISDSNINILYIFHIQNMENFTMYFDYHSKTSCHTYIARQDEDGVVTICHPEEFLKVIPSAQLRNKFLFSSHFDKFFSWPKN